MAINTLESNALFLSHEMFGNSQFGTKMGCFRDSFGFLVLISQILKILPKPCMGQQYSNHIQIWGFYVPVITLSWGINVPFITLSRGFYVPIITLMWGI